MAQGDLELWLAARGGAGVWLPLAVPGRTAQPFKKRYGDPTKLRLGAPA